MYPLNRFKSPVVFSITERSNAILLIWLYVFACFGVSFCAVFNCVSRLYLVSFRWLSGELLIISLYFDLL